MVETIYFIGGLVMGVTITILGLKNGAKIYNKAVTDITMPPEFQTEDRTQSTPYNYEDYTNHFNSLKERDDVS